MDFSLEDVAYKGLKDTVFGSNDDENVSCHAATT